MKKQNLLLLVMLPALFYFACKGAPDDPVGPPGGNDTERKLVAINIDGGVFLSWRLYLDDPLDIAFNVYRNGEKITAEPLGPAFTDFIDTAGTAGATYQVEILSGGAGIGRSETVSVWNEDYLSIPIQKPTGYYVGAYSPLGTVLTDSMKTTYTAYTPVDATIADLDGDGELDIVFFWTPDNLQDPSQTGTSAVTFIDAYKLDGTKLWGSGKYINLGPNIRSGPHYNTYVVMDFDGDGRAEIVHKTGPLTMDTTGRDVALDIDPTEAGRVYKDTGGGKIRNGPEYFTVFDGATGKALATEFYVPIRGGNEQGGTPGASWGDDTMNRADRFLSCGAYLGGRNRNPSFILCRGYYARTSLVAYDWDGTTIKRRWIFDTNPDIAGLPNYTAYRSQGYHGLAVADVDDDGRDDIVYGNLLINSYGIPVYSTGQGHGDWMHVGKFHPTFPGLQFMGSHEIRPFGLSVRNVTTGQIYWRHNGTDDTGRGMTADIDPNYPGNENWASSELAGVYDFQGNQITPVNIRPCNNSVYWDGDTGCELYDSDSKADPVVITKPVRAEDAQGNLTRYNSSTVKTLTGSLGSYMNNGKSILHTDIFGDWREELIMRSADNNSLRIYTTTIPTVHEGPGKVPPNGIPTLMDNHAYRMAMVWQHTGYNQMPHSTWFIGYNMEDIRK